MDTKQLATQTANAIADLILNEEDCTVDPEMIVRVFNDLSARSPVIGVY